MLFRTTLLATTLLITGAIAADKPDVNPKPPCTVNTAACMQQIAQLYIDALVSSHDGAKLPLAPDVRRTEQGLTNARGPYEVRESFVRTKMVKGARDVRFYADEKKGEIVAFYVTDVELDKADATATTKAGDTDYKVAVSVPAGEYSLHEAERFKIVNGYITEIEIVAHVETGKGGGSGWPVPRDAKTK